MCVSCFLRVTWQFWVWVLLSILMFLHLTKDSEPYPWPSCLKKKKKKSTVIYNLEFLKFKKNLYILWSNWQKQEVNRALLISLYCGLFSIINGYCLMLTILCLCKKKKKLKRQPDYRRKCGNFILRMHDPKMYTFLVKVTRKREQRMAWLIEPYCEQGNRNIHQQCR